MKQRGNGIFEVEDAYLWLSSGWRALHRSVILQRNVERAVCVVE